MIGTCGTFLPPDAPEALVWRPLQCAIGRKATLGPQKMEQTMKKIASTVLALSLALSSTAAFAGGPVVVVEEAQPEVVAESPRSGWIVPVVVGLIVVCAIACGNDDETVVN